MILRHLKIFIIYRGGSIVGVKPDIATISELGDSALDMCDESRTDAEAFRSRQKRKQKK
jgi:hypothetical protein